MGKTKGRSLRLRNSKKRSKKNYEKNYRKNYKKSSIKKSKKNSKKYRKRSRKTKRGNKKGNIMKGGVEFSPGSLYIYRIPLAITAYKSIDQLIKDEARSTEMNLREATSKKGFIESQTQYKKIRERDIIYVLGFVDIRGEDGKAIHCQVFPSNGDKMYEAYLDLPDADSFSLWFWDNSDKSVNKHLQPYLNRNNPELLGLVERTVSPFI